MENPAKKYLYHRVPDDMETSGEGRAVLYPLNQLKEKFPGLFLLESEKYNSSEQRKNIPGTIIPTLEAAAWGDVLQMSAIHPEDLKKALVAAGYAPREMRFYQIDPDLLDPAKMTIYLYRDDLENDHIDNYTPFDPKSLVAHSAVPEITAEYYFEVIKRGERPFLFVGVPHIFHHGPIDVSDFPVIVV